MIEVRGRGKEDARVLCNTGEYMSRSSMALALDTPDLQPDNCKVPFLLDGLCFCVLVLLRPMSSC